MHKTISSAVIEREHTGAFRSLCTRFAVRDSGSSGLITCEGNAEFNIDEGGRDESRVRPMVHGAGDRSCGCAGAQETRVNNASPGYICMAVYEPNPDLLAIQIESIINQTETNWRCVVGIDGESPSVEATVRDLTQSDDRFSVVAFEKRAGFYRNFERLLALVPEETPWVAPSDQDDNWYPKKLETLIPSLSEYSLVVAQARVVQVDAVDDGAPTTVRRAVGLAAMLIDNQVTGSLAVFRGSLLRNALPFPEPTDLAYHDHWLGICAIVEDGIKWESVVVQDYVQHGGNVIGESGGASMKSRLGRLSNAADGASLGAQLDYLSEHRWGWRVNMARAALARYPELAPTPARTLKIFARNRFGVRLFWTTSVEGLSKRAPLARGLALVIGSTRARVLERSRSADN